MRQLLIVSFLVTSFLPQAFSQFTPLSLFERKPPQGCQYPPLSDGTYIYFTNQSNPLLHYSIYTPWTRFYPDALRADLVEQGFQLSVQHGKNESDGCGWETIDIVKKHGWHRGDVSFRPLPKVGVKTTKALDKPSPNNMTVSLLSSANPPATGNASIEQQTSMVVHLVNHTRRADSSQKVHLGPELRPTNETINRIHSVLASNSPEADILFMMIEITFPILGVIAFLTFVLLLMRRITNKLYPNTKEDSEAGDIELSSRRSTSAQSDKTLVNPRKLSQPRSPHADDRFPDTKNGGVFAWRLAMEKPKQARQSPSLKAKNQYPHANTGGFFGLSVEQPPRRESSSIYSRSMDGVTLYPESNMASWGSR
ncbi:hypothetical protein P171DRAFT_483597 [Karstenula rhodostoma CBS 690.94]|uniref:Uncharacterized protein n=1 Tax=Karstenula rhodostoma CBS 690.94 TaxID=1392251 RepID=A0A9P4PNP9_9PLEO|nr:hypothetical protein P171DRAFT_483597 [Karstenula rhodostoma CBS 690.94]